MRTLSASALASMVAQNTDEVWLVLLTLDHADLAEPIRVVNNMENIVSRGDTFIGFPFSLILPEQTPETLGTAQLIVDNVDRQIIDTVRTIQSPPSALIEVILASQPDTVEIAMGGLTMRDVSADVNSVRGTLRFENVTIEPVAELMTAARFPGLH